MSAVIRGVSYHADRFQVSGLLRQPSTRQGSMDVWRVRPVDKLFRTNAGLNGRKG